MLEDLSHNALEETPKASVPYAMLETPVAAATPEMLEKAPTPSVCEPER